MEQKYLKYKSKYLDLKTRQSLDDSVGRMTGGALPFQLSLVNNSLGSLAKDNSIINKNPYIFNHEIMSKLPIT